MRAIGRLLAVIVAVAVTVCWVAGCAKTLGWDAVPETRDTLTVTSDTLSETRDTLSVIPTTLTDKRDGKTYKTVTIGKQIWMAENLNYATSSGSWCYGDDSSNCDTYGRLYDWSTAISVCPSGWHLSTRDDWDQLVEFVGGDSSFWILSNGIEINDWLCAGTKLKSSSGWNSSSDTPVGANDFGFSALPGGCRYSSGNSDDAGDYGRWWTATEGVGDRAYVEYDRRAYGRGMGYDHEHVAEYYYHKSGRFSVRCVQNK